MSDTTGTQGADPTGTEELASAYLDGEATPDERAQVEASAELLDEVERLRQVRAVLGATTEPPPISVREAHLAAALDVWDRMPETERSGEATPSAGMDAAAAAAITTPAPTSLSSRRERRSGGGSTKWLLGAAAGLAVIAGAGVVLQGIGSGSDDDSDSVASEEAPAEEPASEADSVAADAADDFNGLEAESAPIEVNEDDAESEDLFSEPDAAASDEAMEEPADEEAMEDGDAMEDDSQTSSAGEAEPSSPEFDLDPLETPDDLADFGAIAVYVDRDPTTQDDDAGRVEIEPTFDTCEDEFAPFFTIEQYAGPALYQGDLVFVGIDLDANPPSVIAYDASECRVVEQTPLPSEDEFTTSRES